MINNIVENKLSTLPDSSGVYLMKDKDDEIIYVGKAKVLKNRVKQYFRKNTSHTPKVLKMIEQIHDFEYIITNSEVEALILECNLIKKHRPYYNILMRDDKTYPYIKVTIKDDYPRIFTTREYKKDGSKYFGPYANGFHSKRAVNVINEFYPLAMCKKDLKYGVKKSQVCLNYHIGQCLGVCSGNIKKEVYEEQVKEVLKILSGNIKDIVTRLTKDMEEASENLEYETAGKYKEKIIALKSLINEQNVSNSSSNDTDILGCSLVQDMAVVQVFSLRDSKIVTRESYILKGQNDKDKKQVLSSFIKQFYSNTPFIPPEIIVGEDLLDKEEIILLLKSLKNGNIKINLPIKGQKKKLLLLADENAKIYLENIIGKEKRNKLIKEMALKEICEFSGIEKKEDLIFESYDISNIYGTNNVGVMVSFKNGEKNSKYYRKFKIKSVEGMDDYASMIEVVFRRLNRAKEEMERKEQHPKFLPLPDIIFTDGGKGHVSTIKTVVDTFDFNIVVLGLVKNTKHKLKALVKDDGVEESILSFKNSSKLLNEISEEVHRYALDYHRNLRSKSMLKNSIEDIEGIGKNKSKNLFIHFKTIENMKLATIAQIQEVKGINEDLAKKVYEFFHGQ